MGAGSSNTKRPLSEIGFVSRYSDRYLVALLRFLNFTDDNGLGFPFSRPCMGWAGKLLVGIT